MASEDRTYRSTVSGRMGKTARRGPSPVFLATRRLSFAGVGSEGQAAVRQRPQFGRLVADLSASFVGLPARSIDAAIRAALRQTAEVLGVDHSAYYQSTGNGLTVAHSWPAQSFEKKSDSTQANNLKWLADELRRKGVLLLSKSRVASGGSAKQEFLSRLGLESAALVGVMRGGSLLGALILGSLYDEAAWGGDPEPPQILGAVLAAALARKQTEERLIESDHLSHAMLDSLECHIVVVNQDGRVIAGSAGRLGDAEGGAPFLNGVSQGTNYFDTCRLALENGLESAASLLEGIDAVVKGSREMFEMEYEDLSPAGQRFFLVSVTPRNEAGSGAVISHIETTERRLAQTNLRELSGKMITALEEERRRIARELHDDVSQRLALMGIEMEQIIQTLPRK